MTNTQTILRGAKSPEAMHLDLTPGDVSLDMRTVTDVTLTVRGDGCGAIEQTWDTTLGTSTLTTLACDHIFDVDGLETANPGRHAIVATVTAPTGTYRVGPFYLVVLDW